MANKLDTEKPLFLGKIAVREATTFGAIRKAVNDLNKGEGVKYSELEAHLLANFKPVKSDNYGPSYIKAYVRDAVGKFDYLSHEDLGVEYSVVEPAKPKVEAEAKPKKKTKADLARDELLQFVKTRGEVNSLDEINESQVDVAAIVQETKKKQKTVEKMVEELKNGELVRTGVVGESTYVFLTEKGWNYLNDLESAEASASEDAAGETAEESVEA